jgi:AcrR family transcriptional regulator
MLTRDAVVAASLELGQESGEEALTMRALAAKLGVSATSLYGIFDGKEAILRELRAGAWSGLAESMKPALRNGRRRERLQQLCEAYLKFAAENPWLYALAMEGPPVEPSEEAEPSPAEIALQALRDGAPTGTADADLHMQVIDMWASLHGLSTLRSSGQLGRAAAQVGMEAESFPRAYVASLVDSLAPETPLRIV